jgi:hypothetical protein
VPNTQELHHSRLWWRVWEEAQDLDELPQEKEEDMHQLWWTGIVQKGRKIVALVQ